MIVLLIALTAFFVAAEFAMVKVRSSRIDQLAAEGRFGAGMARRMIGQLDDYLSACQLGITMTALALGWLGEPAVYRLLRPLLLDMQLSETAARIVSFILAFSIITFLHVVAGELAPKIVAVQKCEQILLLFAGPLVLFYKLTYPFIWTLNGAARLLVGIFGLQPVSEREAVHSEEELRLILSESYESGAINHLEYKYVTNIFEFDNRIAKEIMVPRTEITGLYVNDTLEVQMAVIQKEKYTRYPIFGEDKDDIIGMVNVKDLFIRYMNGEKTGIKQLRQFMRPVIEVIETVPIHELLLEMQKRRIPMAVLYDEYGGTAGLVTLEDILEEIVGEIRDEYDEDERPPIQHIGATHKIVDGKVRIDEINDLLGVHIHDGDVDTIAGWIMLHNHEIQPGEAIEAAGYEFRVLAKDMHQIKQIEIQHIERVQTE